jgi:hypothetical protein
VKHNKRSRAGQRDPNEFHHGLPEDEIRNLRTHARRGMDKASLRKIFQLSKGQLKRILRGG